LNAPVPGYEWELGFKKKFKKKKRKRKLKILFSSTTLVFHGSVHMIVLAIQKQRVRP
jgi:hypothetical protein